MEERLWWCREFVLGYKFAEAKHKRYDCWGLGPRLSLNKRARLTPGLPYEELGADLV